MFILDFLFPQKCFSCQKETGWICSPCLKKTLLKKRQFCPACRQPAVFGRTHFSCRRETALEGAIALFPYRSYLQKIMKGYKYRLAQELISVWADLAKKGLADKKGLINLWKKERFCIVPVPLFAARERWRGFNQAQEMAKQIARQTGLPLNCRLAARKRWTRPQSKLQGGKRQKNLRSSFSLIAAARLKGSNFIIFDDILTTGQTMESLGKVLKKNGAGKIWGLAMLG